MNTVFSPVTIAPLLLMGQASVPVIRAVGGMAVNPDA
jgi:hypothetical protein